VRRQFRDSILDLAQHDSRIVLIFGDVSVYLFKEFQDKYPSRFYNMGICENTLVSVGAGLSSQGLIPFIHSIAPFVTERCLEQIKVDMCYNRFGGNIVTCGASYDYAWDGVTHHCYTDLAILRLLPDIEVVQPGSKKELDVLLRSQYDNGKLTYFRLSDYPHNFDIDVIFGKGAILKKSPKKVTIVTAGPILKNVWLACKSEDVNLLYFSTIKPIDKVLINKFKHTKILVIHDSFGLHDAICDIPGLNVSSYGIPKSFYEGYGTLEDARKNFGLDPNSIKKALKDFIKNAP